MAKITLNVPNNDLPDVVTALEKIWSRDASRRTITTETDVYPTSFKMIAGTTNRVQLSWLRISYV